jgi:hypothetical protein
VCLSLFQEIPAHVPGSKFNCQWNTFELTVADRMKNVLTKEDILDEDGKEHCYHVCYKVQSGVKPSKRADAMKRIQKAYDRKLTEKFVSSWAVYRSICENFPCKLWSGWSFEEYQREPVKESLAGKGQTNDPDDNTDSRQQRLGSGGEARRRFEQLAQSSPTSSPNKGEKRKHDDDEEEEGGEQQKTPPEFHYAPLASISTCKPTANKFKKGNSANFSSIKELKRMEKEKVLAEKKLASIDKKNKADAARKEKEEAALRSKETKARLKAEKKALREEEQRFEREQKEQVEAAKAAIAQERRKITGRQLVKSKQEEARKERATKDVTEKYPAVFAKQRRGASHRPKKPVSSSEDEEETASTHTHTPLQLPAAPSSNDSSGNHSFHDDDLRASPESMESMLIRTSAGKEEVILPDGDVDMPAADEEEMAAGDDGASEYMFFDDDKENTLEEAEGASQLEGASLAFTTEQSQNVLESQDVDEALQQLYRGAGGARTPPRATQFVDDRTSESVLDGLLSPGFAKAAAAFDEPLSDEIEAEPEESAGIFDLSQEIPAEDVDEGDGLVEPDPEKRGDCDRDLGDHGNPWEEEEPEKEPEPEQEQEEPEERGGTDSPPAAAGRLSMAICNNVTNSVSSRWSLILSKLGLLAPSHEQTKFAQNDLPIQTCHSDCHIFWSRR